MEAAERKRRNSVTPDQVRDFAAGRPELTTGDLMRRFGCSRSQARDRLQGLAAEGGWEKRGNGGGAKYVRIGPAQAPTNGDLRSKLLNECDAELARIENAISTAEQGIAAMQEELATLRGERRVVARAQGVLGTT